MKLLIVDDNAAVRRLIVSIVQPFADEVRESGDAADALAAYESQRPDLVLMDICLKEVDGITATREITAADPKAKIVVVTDYDDDAFRHAAAQAGACGYVLKNNLLELVGILRFMQEEDQR